MPSSASFYKYKAKYGGMDVSDARKLKALEDENTKLKVTTRLLPRQLCIDASDDFGVSPKVCEEDVPLLQ